jgi:alpha-beta hydrolase superfamily lysophospholipase
MQRNACEKIQRNTCETRLQESVHFRARKIDENPIVARVAADMSYNMIHFRRHTRSGNIRGEWEGGMQVWASGSDLAGYRVTPTVQTRAAVVFLHAFADHAGRHERTMRRLADRGIIAYAYDHRGHGRSPGRRAFVSDFDGLCDDALMMIDAVAARESQHPLFVLGAGMGGIVALHVALQRPDMFSGLVLVGPTFSGGSSTSGVMRKLNPLLANFIPMAAAESHDIRALSRNPTVVEEFRADPLTHNGGIPSQTGQALGRAAEHALARAPEIRVPVLIVHGEDDKIASIRGSQHFVEASGNPQHHLYAVPAGHHEPFNDPGGDTLVDEVGIWIRERARR